MAAAAAKAAEEEAARLAAELEAKELAEKQAAEAAAAAAAEAEAAAEKEANSTITENGTVSLKVKRSKCDSQGERLEGRQQSITQREIELNMKPRKGLGRRLYRGSKRGSIT